MYLYEINTTSFKEENFTLMTSLNEEEITNVIKPIKQKFNNSLNDNDEYTNETLVQALRQNYPAAEIHFFQTLEKITI